MYLQISSSKMFSLKFLGFPAVSICFPSTVSWNSDELLFALFASEFKLTSEEDDFLRYKQTLVNYCLLLQYAEKCNCIVYVYSETASAFVVNLDQRNI